LRPEARTKVNKRSEPFKAGHAVVPSASIGAKKLLEGVVPEWMITLTGSLLVLFSAFCFVVAVWRNLFTGAPPPDPDVGQLPPALLVAANGFLTLVALAALLSIWFGRTGGN